jgi:cell division septation protein DedD
MTSTVTYFDGNRWVLPPIPIESSNMAPEHPQPVLATVAPRVTQPPDAAPESAPIQSAQSAVKETSRPAVIPEKRSSAGTSRKVSQSGPAVSGTAGRTAKSPVSTAGKPTPGVTYGIQIRAFQDETKANAFLRDLQAHYEDVHISKIQQPDRQTWHRVLVGRFPTHKAASAFLKKGTILNAYPGSFVQRIGNGS